MQKKLLVTVTGKDFTDFDIMKALMSIGLNVEIEAAPNEAAQHRVQADLLPCGHSSDNLGNFGGCNPMGSCVICDAATSR